MTQRIGSGKPDEARAVLNPEQPDRLLRYEYDRGSNYEADTRLTAALSALIPAAELFNDDHRMFQVVHLVSEFMWCTMHHELGRACAALDEDDFGLAARLLNRAVGLADIPVRCLRLLQDFLPQASFLRLRTVLLSNASGLDSPGGRNLRRAGMAVWRSFEGALQRHDLTLRDLTEENGRDTGPAGEAGLAALGTVQHAMLRLDGEIMEWNQRHLLLVRSHLGGHPAAKSDAAPVSLRGESTRSLQRLAEKALFPRLWQGVDETYARIPRPA